MMEKGAVEKPPSSSEGATVRFDSRLNFSTRLVRNFCTLKRSYDSKNKFRVKFAEMRNGVYGKM